MYSLTAHYKKYLKWKTLFLFLGPLAYILIRLADFEGLSPQGKAVLACSAWTAIWWMTEAVELEAASLLPIITFPLSGALSVSEVTSSYGNPYIYLFLGGFIVGLAIERCNLHRRIAFNIISWIGRSEKKVILGFMVATGFISMWISNTAAAIMMLPIGASVISHLGGRRIFGRNLMLGIAYAASIGGMATLIGTPPNIILAGVVKEANGVEISFFQWMLFALPFSCILLLFTWFLLTRFKPAPAVISESDIGMEDIGKITVPEKRVLIIFVLAAFFWISRSLLWETLIPGLDDTIIAVTAAVLLFVIPSGSEEGGKLMDWQTARKLPWGVLLLFGAGLAIAKGFSTTDLSEWLARQFMQFEAMPAIIIMLIVVAGINFLTEITSNTATASMVLPLLITLAASLSMEPLTLMAGAVLAASCAFMLPVATPPNAIMFSSGQIKIGEMMRAGFIINIFSILLILLAVEFWWPLVWS